MASDGDGESFVAERVRFAESAREGRAESDETPEGVGSVEAIRGTTGEMAADIEAPDVDGECPHCGLTLPASGPPLCPRCGAPY